MLEFESQGETRVKVAERADGGEQNSFSGCGFDLRVDAAHVKHSTGCGENSRLIDFETLVTNCDRTHRRFQAFVVFWENCNRLSPAEGLLGALRLRYHEGAATTDEQRTFGNCNCPNLIARDFSYCRARVL